MPSSIEDILGVDTWKLCSTWKDVLAAKESFDEPGRWVFRGQRLAAWSVKSTFERESDGGGSEAEWKYEAAILREFTRRAHHLYDGPASSS